MLLLQFADEVPRDVAHGDAILDASGYGNHGVMQGAASFVGGATLSVGLSLKNGGMKIPNSPTLQINHSITIEIWIKANNLTCGYVVLKPGSYGFPKLTDDKKMAFYMDRSSRLGRIYTQNDYQLHYHVITSSPKVTRLYLDGRIVQESQYPITEMHHKKLINL